MVPHCSKKKKKLINFNYEDINDDQILPFFWQKLIFAALKVQTYFQPLINHMRYESYEFIIVLNQRHCSMRYSP